MKRMICPLNGPRNIQEFVYGGDVVAQPDSQTCSDAEWADYVFLEDNRAGVVQEWWCHVASAYWFIAERNRVTDEILRTFDPGELFGERVEFSAAAPAPEEPTDAGESGP